MKWLTLLLTGAVFVSAIQLVLVRHQNRLRFTELQTLQQQRDKLNEEWGRLQLEQSTWAQPQRIETMAYEQLGMHPPQLEDIVIIRLK